VSLSLMTVPIAHSNAKCADASKESKAQMDELEKSLNENRGLLHQARQEAGRNKDALFEAEAQVG